MVKSDQKVTIKQDWPLALTYVYLFLPVLLFFFFWLKWYVGIPLGLLMIWAADRSFFEDTPLWQPKKQRARSLVILGGLLLIALVVLCSGIGGAVPQYPDHIMRNTIFRDLVERPWPVKMPTSDGYIRSLCYYIGFWLPAALVGKVTTLQIGWVSLQVWAFVGLALIWLFISERQQAVRLTDLLIFFLFGGADALGTLLTGNIYGLVGNRFEWWEGYLNYPSVLTQLFWAYNQAIYGWLLFQLLMRQKSNKRLLLIWSVGLLSCTFPAIGMIPFVVQSALDNSGKTCWKQRWRAGLRDAMTLENGIGLLSSLILALYASTNVAVYTGIMGLFQGNPSIDGSRTAAVGTAFQAFHWTSSLYGYLWFLLLEVGFYCIVLWLAKNRGKYFWLTVIVLALCPLIKVGNWVDFCMRSSMPALFCLYHLVLDTMKQSKKEKKWVIYGCLLFLIGLSAINAGDTIRGVLGPMAELYQQGQRPQMQFIETTYFADFDNFFGRSKTFFYQYLLR